MAVEQANKERNRLLLVKHNNYTSTQHKTIHLLMLAVKQADKERNRLLLVEYTCIDNIRSCSKTHLLMLAMEQADKERNRLLLVEYI